MRWAVVAMAVVCGWGGLAQVAGSKAAPEGRPAAGNAVPRTVVFTKYTDKTEAAFTTLIPKGWRTEGGIVRVDPNAAGGAGNSVAAKVDFTTKRDAQGSVLMRWLPETAFIDLRGTPVGNTGMFPQGSNYNGMAVYPCPSAADFLTSMVFPILHPSASNVKVLSRKAMPKVAEGYRKLQAALMPGLSFQYDAAMVEVSYDEGGTRYKERLFTGIENMGAIASGMWGNKNTLQARAPEAQFKAWEPVGAVILGSVEISPKWLAGEIRGQAQRSQTVLQTQRDIAEIERQIVESRRKTNAEIQNDMYLTLTGQEDYVNPYTKQVERGPDDWKYRWQNELGEIVYTNDQVYDPNHDLELKKQGFKRSQVRKR
ncbi:MAG TPA: hypothetical protein VGN26_14000 [Armatimonadota bacterium]